MTIEEIKDIFTNVISSRNWYSSTSINRFQANELKRRFKKNELSLGRILEVLIECGYNIIVSKK